MDEVQESTPEEISTPVEETPAPSYAGTKHKIKIDNQEIEVPYEDLINDYQMKGASQKRFNEASSMKKEVDNFIGSLKGGDLSQLKKVMSPEQIREFAEKELLEYVKYEQMSDEQKENLTLKQERDLLKAEKEEIEKQQKQSYSQRIEQEATQELDQEIGQAIRDLKVSKGIDPKEPIEPWFIDHVARIMLAHLETNETAEKMPAKLATDRAWSGVEKTVSSYLKTISPQKALEMLPPALRDAIRKADVSDATTQMHKRVRGSGEEQRPKKTREKPSTESFFEKLDSRFG